MDPTAIVYIACTSAGLLASLTGATVMLVRKMRKKYKLKLEERPDLKKIREDTRDEVIQEALKTLKELKDKDQLSESSFRNKLENARSSNQLYPKS